VLLVVAVVVPLLVPTYAKPDPHLWGVPFVYWYQLMWVFLSAILVSISYRLLRAEERRRRAAQGLGDPEAADATDTAAGADVKEGDQ
jgi:hypothetical protein